jgi:hypothetical protein
MGMRTGMAGILLALMIGVLLLILIEIRKWQTGRSLISKRQFAIRMVGGALLWALVTAVFVGIYVLRLGTPKGHPVLFLIFWLSCVAAAFVLMFLAIADLRQVENQQTQRQAQLWRDMARIVAGKPPAEEPKPKDSRGTGAP